MVVIDPLTPETILGLDMLATCTVDLSHKRLITGAGHVIELECQRQNIKDTVCVNDGQHDSCAALPSFKTADTLVATDTVEKFGVLLPMTGHVLSVKVTENDRVPSFSELEIVVQVKGYTNDTNSCYLLESNLQNSGKSSGHYGRVCSSVSFKCHEGLSGLLLGVYTRYRCQ